MDDQAALVDKLRRYFEHSGTDPDSAHEIYHDDAVLELPQSGAVRGRRQLQGVAVPLRRPTLAVRGTADRVPGRQGGTRADLRHEGLGGTRVAGSVALGHSRGPAGVSVPRPGLDHGSSLL